MSPGSPQTRDRAGQVRLASVDDLFGDSGENSNELEVRLDELHPFPNHPFKVLLDKVMEELVSSIREHGLFEALEVREKPEGGYEIISGHRRLKACEMADLARLRVRVVEADDNTAILRMVESNLHRPVILPSEKAFSYKMQLEALTRKAGRPKNNLSQVGTHLRSDKELSKKTGESRNQIQRYICLTELLPQLLDMVDNKKLPFTC
ncbi:MAG: ParB/RepB/Spo0J family partition protein [Oscillospiraceae bacterium]|jgi:ParB family chromosome partitioning protein|nr:ParB/RepB/Spo0J family partition protein [Oscillospiraceae bacterium]